jgi:hypothetical protein
MPAIFQLLSACSKPVSAHNQLPLSFCLRVESNSALPAISEFLYTCSKPLSVHCQLSLSSYPYTSRKPFSAHSQLSLNSFLHLTGHSQLITSYSIFELLSTCNKLFSAIFELLPTQQDILSSQPAISELPTFSQSFLARC